MKAKLQNGVTLEGDKDSVLELLKKLNNTSNPFNPDEMHYSETKGEWVALEDMDTMYLKNVVLKELEKALKVLRIDAKALTPQDFVERCDELYQDAEKYIMELEMRDDE